MRESWLGLVDRLLRPERPGLAACARERDRHLAERARVEDERRRAMADCERRIEAARARVFAADDGVVTLAMTALEREWRLLARRDPDGALMDLWARMTPSSWWDEKRWRDSPAAEQLEVAVALASDVAGVEAAERAARAFVDACGLRVAPRVRFRIVREDTDALTDLLAEPIRVASAGMSTSALARAEGLAAEIEAAVLARLPERPGLAHGVARAAFADALRAAPAAPLRDVLATGYGLMSADASGITLELPHGQRL